MSPPEGPATRTAPDLSVVDEVVARIGRGRENAIAILQALQERYHYLPREALERVCELSEITPAQIAGVSTFYNQFRHEPAGLHVISICHGTACHVKGATLVHDALKRHLGLASDEGTDSRGLFTVEKVACLGCCTLAPVMQIDGVTYGHLTPESIPRTLSDFLELSSRIGRSEGAEAPAARPEGLAEIRVGVGSCCVAGGSLEVRDELARAVSELGARAVVKPVSCVGMCHNTPLVEVVTPDGRSALYAKVRPQDAAGIVRRHFRPRGLARRVIAAAATVLERVLTDESWDGVERYSLDVRDPAVCAFLGRQRRLATEHYGRLDPLDLDEYLASGGFEALKKVLAEMSPEAVIEAVKRSGLRGRGGAGFPTGLKWAAVRAAPGDTKYLICNGDEGDPGAFMDRMLLESYPYRVLEGMAIAAYAVGTRTGFLYIRAEYPLAVRRIREAIRRLEERSILGESAREGLPLVLRVREGAGAFVCGEETAMIASLEGRRGMPRIRPPFPAEKGLWGRPTCVNNVETFALLPSIIRRGPEEFASIGTATSKGTKVFALTGKVARGGLIEVPMGITIREIVEEVGGGVAGGRRFKAVQIGGPSGGCIPATLGHIPIDYEALTSAGAIMGSGGLVVLDDSDCMVDIARYFLEFTQNQSCGKCTFCRIGTRRMLDILSRLCGGEGRKGDVEELEALARLVKQGSLCGLGKTAPNPVLTTIRYFRDEYEAHVAGRCPAARCKALIRYSITEDCIGCTRCAQRCPAQAIEFRPYERHEIDPSKCIRCGTCRTVCPSDAVKVE